MDNHIPHPLAKFLAALSIVFTIDFLTATGKVAGALLSIALLSEWVWKKLLRPYLRKRQAVVDPLTAPSTLGD